jgi:hypothetical protein
MKLMFFINLHYTSFKIKLNLNNFAKFILKFLRVFLVFANPKFAQDAAVGLGFSLCCQPLLGLLAAVSCCTAQYG